MKIETKPLWGLGLAAILIAVGAIGHGQLSQRWGATEQVEVVAQRFNELPNQVGPWKLQQSVPLGETAAEQLQCHGYISHSYVNQLTQESVNVAVLMGPPGPIAVHTPEICYSSRDYTVATPREACRVDATDETTDELWGLTFKSRDISAHRLRVYYGWTTDGTWQAAERPRYDFGGTPYLFKIQIAAVIPNNEATMIDPARSFLEEFTPLLRCHLFFAEALRNSNT